MYSLPRGSRAHFSSSVETAGTTDARTTSRLDRDLEHTLPAAAEDFVALLYLVEREGVRQERRQVYAPATDDLHEPAHALLAAGAERRHDAVVAEARGEGFVREMQLARVDAEA